MNLVEQRDLERLYEHDQLNLQMVAGLSFPFYSEARITFMPTYKFDIGSDNYDSSEKARIPAWTDRVLRKGPNLRQLAYNCAPLKFSDHRPVYALFECQVSVVNEVVRDKISREIYLKRKNEVGDATANQHTEDTEDEDLIGYDAIEPGLPPASSDRQKWWLENGKPAQSTITAPKTMDGSTSTILNPADRPIHLVPRMSLTGSLCLEQNQDCHHFQACLRHLTNISITRPSYPRYPRPCRARLQGGSCPLPTTRPLSRQEWAGRL